MSEESLRRGLWLALLLMLPLPLLGLQSGLVPVGRMLLLGGLCVAVIALESARGVVPILAAMFLLQALAYAGLLWLVSWGSARATRSRSPRLRRRALLLLLLVGFALTSRFDLYEAPYGAGDGRATLLEIYR